MRQLKTALLRIEGGPADTFAAAAEAEAASAKAAEAAAACPWSYEGANGPANWGTICGKIFSECATGMQQSPINIKLLRMRQGPGQSMIGWKIPSDAYNKFVTFGGGGDYLESYDGHSFVVSHADALFPFGGVTYKLQSFHTHTVSEHTIDGEHYDMEMQFVHKTVDGAKFSTGLKGELGQTLIVSVMFQVGKGQGSPHWLRQLAKAVPSVTNESAQVIPLDFTEVAQSVMVGSLPQDARFKDFKPNYNHYYGYTGSLTTPPCTQGVQWLVLANPIYAEAEDIQAFKDLEGDNFRPVQRINGRIVTQRYCGLSCE